MSSRKYRIIMQTPLGARHGMMSVVLSGRNVNGMIEILNHTEPFQGTIMENGDCRITGRLITLMRNINYTAVGNINPYTVRLTVEGERNIFRLSGNFVREQNEEEDENWEKNSK